MSAPSLPVVERQIQLHATQLAFRQSQALYRGFVGGRGSGKTWVGAYDLLMRAKPGRTYMIASPTGVLMQDTTFPTVRQIAQDLGLWGKIKHTPYPTLTTTTGATIRFRTADDPEKLRGPNLSGVWLDEASLMDQAAYDIAIACLREAGEQGWLSATFTPKGLTHWTYEIFGQIPPKQNTELFRCTTNDNPFLPAEFEATLKGQYGEGSRFALQELGGQFVSMEGVEWPPEFFGPHIWFDEWPGDLVLKVMALDPSKGKADKSGDPSAWICLGIDSAQLPCLWVDADIEWRPVEPLRGEDVSHTIVGDGIRLFQQFKPSAIVVETNGFQEMVAQSLQRWGHAKGHNLPIWTMNNTDPKAARIRSLGPFFAQRRFRVRKNRGGEMLVAQLRDFTGNPNSEIHDDGPDGLKLAEQLANHLLFGGDSGVKLLAV